LVLTLLIRMYLRVDIKHCPWLHVWPNTAHGYMYGPTLPMDTCMA